MLYQYYDPHPHICRMKQYECCKNYNDCPLYHICKTMNKEQITSACKKDCATCTYTGCSMPPEQRTNNPLYTNGFTSTSPLPLPIEAERAIEQEKHVREHAKKYHLYNWLWGDYKEKRKASTRDRDYYYSHREQILKQKEEKRRKQGMQPISERKIKILPPCGGDCLNCNKTDCDLPDTWNEKNAYAKYWRQQNHERYNEYRKKYYADNIERERERLKNWRKDNPEKLKAQREKYNAVRREKYKENKTIINEKRKEHYAANREKLAEQKRIWTAANKEKINARRRELYAEKKKLAQAI